MANFYSKDYCLRRLAWNFALDRAIELARELKKPLVILDALRCAHPWASERFHQFAIDGMAEKQEALSGSCDPFPVKHRPGRKSAERRRYERQRVILRGRRPKRPEARRFRRSFVLC
jgi:hypothetical protein